MKSTIFPTLGLLGLAAILSTTVFAQQPAPKVPDFKKEVAPVVKKYCVSCHTGEYAPEGVVFPATMTEAWAKSNARVMRKAAKEIKAKKMPPADSTQPKAAESKAFTDWVAAKLPQS
jgi:uncharacterized membrane protein